MEKQLDLTLMKARSYRSILSAGFRLYIENFRRLFKASWQMVLLYAIICGWLGTMIAIKIPEMMLGIIQGFNNHQGLFMEDIRQYALTFFGLCGLSVLAIITMTLASATILNKLKEHKETGHISVPPHWFIASPQLMGRTLKGVIFTLLLILLLILLFVGLMFIVNSVSPQFTTSHLYTLAAAFLVVLLISLILALPLYYILMKYVLEAPCGYWQTLSHHYGKATRHWGSLFLVFFVSSLLVFIAITIIMMPAHILNLANQSAQAGVLMGDPLGMPSYMTILTFVTFLFCNFIQFYVSHILLIHNYYIYGSIETKEEEKKKIENP